MRRASLFQSLLLTVLVVALITASAPSSAGAASGVAAPSAALGTGFTYQGQLMRAGDPVDDACLFTFRLYDDAIAGTMVGSAVETSSPITVTTGVFQVVLNKNGEFGPTAFAGDARWLDVQVKCSDDPAYVELGRQELTAAPYALYAEAAGHAQSAENANTLDGLDGSSFGRIGRYGIPGGSGAMTVTIPIPHYNAFQIVIGEAFGSPNQVAWLSAVENDHVIAYIGIDPSGNVITGTADLGLTTTIMTLGPNIRLQCPGSDSYELLLVSEGSLRYDVRAFVVW
ncbi:MAG: hypothetical protein GX601_12405 [Anaerolineales bacterium]|nr:hypothetical protein [Anaerolineales bacterium]